MESRCALPTPDVFGACVWQAAGEGSKLLDHLGPEPLSADFNADYIYAKAVSAPVPLKPLSWIRSL